MRILEITDAKGWSGGAQQALFLSRGLKEKGHDVILACWNDSEIKKRAIDERIPVATVKMRQEYDVFAILELKRIIEKHKIDIVHAHHPKAHSLGLAASVLSKVPVFLFTRRVVFPIRKSLFSQIKYKSKRIDKIIAVSKGVKTILVEYGIAHKRIEVIYSSTDLARFNSKINPGKIKEEFNIPDDFSVVGLIGNFSYYKGHTFFLEAIPLILKQIPKTKFILAGRDTDKEELKNLVVKLGISQNTILAGFRRDVPEILAVTDLTVNTSLQEGFAGTIRESLAMAKPVVATNIGGNPEMVLNNKNGLLIPPKDAGALAEGVIKLLSNKEILRKLGEEGCRLVKEKFSVETMVTRTEKLYENLLNKKRQG